MTKFVTLTNKDIPEFLKESKFYKESELFNEDQEVQIPDKYFINTNKPTNVKEYIKLFDTYRYWLVGDYTSLYDYCLSPITPFKISHLHLEKLYDKNQYQLPYELGLIKDVIKYREKCSDLDMTDRISCLKNYKIGKLRPRSKIQERLYKSLMLVCVHNNFKDLYLHIQKLFIINGNFTWQFEFELLETACELNDDMMIFIFNNRYNSYSSGLTAKKILKLAAFNNNLKLAKTLHESICDDKVQFTCPIDSERLYSYVATDDSIEFYKYLHKKGYQPYDRVFYRPLSNLLHGETFMNSQKKIIEYLLGEHHKFKACFMEKLMMYRYYDIFKMIYFHKNVTHVGEIPVFFNVLKYDDVEFLKMFEENDNLEERAVELGKDIFSLCCDYGSIECFKYLSKSGYKVD